MEEKVKNKCLIMSLRRKFHFISSAYPRQGPGSSTLSREAKTSLSPAHQGEQQRDIISPSCPGSTPGPQPRRHPSQIHEPRQLACFDVWSSDSTLSPSRLNELLSLSLTDSPATLQILLPVSVISFFHSLLQACDCR